MKRIFLLGFFLILTGLFLGDLNFISLNNSYGSSVYMLSPGIPNLALKKEYDFFKIEKRPFIIMVFIIYPLFFLLVFIKNNWHD